VLTYAIKLSRKLLQYTQSTTALQKIPQRARENVCILYFCIIKTENVLAIDGMAWYAIVVPMPQLPHHLRQFS